MKDKEEQVNLLHLQDEPHQLPLLVALLQLAVLPLRGPILGVHLRNVLRIAHQLPVNSNHISTAKIDPISAVQRAVPVVGQRSNDDPVLLLNDRSAGDEVSLIVKSNGVQ